MSLDLIFLLGLLTGFHCVGMCGGFVVGYTAANARLGRGSYLSHLLYAGGKTLSYTTIGALFGLVGAVVTFTPMLRGVAGIVAGAFLIVFGLNMLGLFAPLRRFRFGLPAPLQRYVDARAHGSHRPFVIGLLNGLMIACGPLQAMYVMAAGTGSAVEGAKMLLAFGLGTLPVMMSFGVMTTLVSASLTHRLLTASGAIVVVLGAVMINRGFILTGWGYDLQSVVASLRSSSEAPPEPATPQEATPSAPAASAPQATAAAASAPVPAQPAFQTIVMDVVESGFRPNHFVLVRGVPVHWVVNGKKITPCNRRIVAPTLGLEFDVKKGRQTIEFTPQAAGVIHWSCWMGMLRGDFTVVDAPTRVAAAPAPAADSAPATPATQSPPPEDYTIAAGDTLSSIAARLYGDAGRWKAILAANPGLDARRLKPGRRIALPKAEATCR
jgi:sulfite exporter TauE/SafE/phage tail protein X